MSYIFLQTSPERGKERNILKREIYMYFLVTVGILNSLVNAISLALDYSFIMSNYKKSL